MGRIFGSVHDIVVSILNDKGMQTTEYIYNVVKPLYPEVNPRWLKNTITAYRRHWRKRQRNK